MKAAFRLADEGARKPIAWLVEKEASELLLRRTMFWLGVRRAVRKAWRAARRIEAVY